MTMSNTYQSRQLGQQKVASLRSATFCCRLSVPIWKILTSENVKSKDKYAVNIYPRGNNV